jgi:hypothetical protein
MADHDAPDSAKENRMPTIEVDSKFIGYRCRELRVI